jgi:hypothetical protein
LSTLVCTLPSFYLGLPLSNSTNKNISWDSLLLFISNHLNNWTFLSINLPAKTVLLKSVLQAIHAYLFFSIDYPPSILKKIRNMKGKILWNGHNPEKKWALVNWDKVFKPKYLGGLGLHDPRKLNSTMGARIWWRWLKTPAEIWAKLWK